MIQIITGHNWLRRHESLQNPEVEPDCRLCLEDEETSWHLMAECPALWKSRQETFQQTFLEPPPEWKVYQIPQFVLRAQIGDLLKAQGNLP